MSIPAINWALAVRASPTQKLVLFAMANHANEAGECHPSVALLVRHTCLSERSVQNALREMKAAGLVAERGKRGLTPLYVLALAAAANSMTPAAGAPPQEMHPAADAGVQQVRPAGDAPPQEVHPAGAAGEGCSSCGEGVQELHPNHQEPP